MALPRPQTASAPAGNMVVARFADGRTLKGTTHDFLPNKPVFHIYVNGDERTKALTVTVAELKAVFFVRDFEGDKERRDEHDLARAKGFGRKARVVFADGETVSGFTTGYNPAAAGFFLLPADSAGNNVRIYVINKAVKEFQWA